MHMGLRCSGLMISDLCETPFWPRKEGGMTSLNVWADGEGIMPGLWLGRAPRTRSAGSRAPEALEGSCFRTECSLKLHLSLLA